MPKGFKCSLKAGLIREYSRVFGKSGNELEYTASFVAVFFDFGHLM